MTTPIYNGTYNADDRLVAPWFIPGWTAQDRIAELAQQGSSVGPGFPQNLSFVRVTGNYFDANSAGLPGYVTVYMSDNITLTTPSTTYRLPQRLTGVMNNPRPFSLNQWGTGVLYINQGFLDITVFATDQTTAGDTIATDSGAAFTYWVTEHFVGGRQYQISVPSADATETSGVDINSLIVAGSVNQYYSFDSTWPMGDSYMPIPWPAS